MLEHIVKTFIGITDCDAPKNFLFKYSQDPGIYEAQRSIDKYRELVHRSTLLCLFDDFNKAKHSWSWSKEARLNMKNGTVLECEYFINDFRRVLGFILVCIHKWQQGL